jgi:hypothetical protein
MPEDGLSIGTLRPADSPVLVRELARMRLRELRAASGISDLPPVAANAIRQHFFHTFEDFLLDEKHGRPGRSEQIGYGRSLDHDPQDAAGYLRHITSRDPAFGRFLVKEVEARIGIDAFDTSVYITGETQSGKSYLSQLLAWHLAGREKSSVWVLDPHGPLARACAAWSKNLTAANFYYFDVGLARTASENDPRRPQLNPFDQLPDKSPATLDIVTQEQVNAFSVMANYSALTDNMRNLLASCIYLMLEMDGGSMQELYRLMDDSRNGDLVARGTRLKNHHHRKLFRHDFRKKKYAATKDALATRLSGLLSSEVLYDIVAGKSTFSIPHAFNTPGVYVFNLGKGVIGDTAGPMLGRLILSQLQAAAFKREKDGLTEQLVPTKNYVFIDEFQNFVSPTTGTIVAEARKYGISLILIQQFVGQGVEPGLMQNILTNTPLKITGAGTQSTYEKVMASQQADREGFEGLRPRLFHVSRRGGQPFVTQAHGFLAGTKERMTPAEQAAFAVRQLDTYYRSPHPQAQTEESGEEVAVVRSIPPEEFTPPRASETLLGASGKGVHLRQDAAALAAVRRALGQTGGPASERPDTQDRISPRRRDRSRPEPPPATVPEAVPPALRSPALRDEEGPPPAAPPAAAAAPALRSPAVREEGGVEPPDGEPVPGDDVSPDVFQSRHRRPKYPA